MLYALMHTVSILIFLTKHNFTYSIIHKSQWKATQHCPVTRKHTFSSCSLNILGVICATMLIR